MGSSPERRSKSPAQPEMECASQMGGLKKLTMMEAESVVAKAVMDCKRGKSVSVCGLPMKALYLATQGVQNLLCKFT